MERALYTSYVYYFKKQNYNRNKNELEKGVELHIKRHFFNGTERYGFFYKDCLLGLLYKTDPEYIILLQKKDNIICKIKSKKYYKGYKYPDLEVGFYKSKKANFTNNINFVQKKETQSIQKRNPIFPHKPSEDSENHWIWSSSKKNDYPNGTKNSGKWLIFANILEIDELWSKIDYLTTIGVLGKMSKCSTIKTHNKQKVICVYTYDYTDEVDVFRIKNALCHIGINRKIYYKTNSDTKSGKYSNNNDKGISKYQADCSLLNSLKRLNNVSYKKIKILNNISIHTLDDLINYESAKLIKGCGVTKKMLLRYKFMAMSLKNNKIYELEKIEIPNNSIYFDIETEPNLYEQEKKVWFIGYNYKNKYDLFYAEKWKDEKKILSNFIKYLKKQNNFYLISYSCNSFDKNVIYKALKRHNLDYDFFINLNHIDLCSEIRKRYIFPLKSYGLKKIGELLNYSFKNKGLDGGQVARFYEKIQHSNERLPKYIFDYVKDDVNSMIYLTRTLMKETFEQVVIEKTLIKKKIVQLEYILDLNDLKCPYCNSEKVIKNGKTKNGKRRYKCNECKKSFS